MKPTRLPIPLFVLFMAFCLRAIANPQGGTPTQGTAVITRQGPQLNIRTSDRAFIDWRSFNIAVGESTTFFQPSASSVVWNRINDPNPSQILGQLNANGLVVLQNQAGFFVGGQAAISVGGLIMTTVPILPPDLLGSSPWQFNGPPPTASIVNYGQINTSAGGPVFLIARDIENRGTISAPGGQVGLYAGQEVLLSERPDGRGLTAQVRLPAGSIDNQGRIIADAGTIALHARVVNQGGLIQANSARERNGLIELYASDNLNLEASSTITARGDSQGTSPGGQVLLKSDNKFSDAPGSVISVAGGIQGGQGGQVEISAPDIAGIQSQIDGSAAVGWTKGALAIDPLNITLSSSGSSAGSGTVGRSDAPATGTLTLNPASFSSFSQITLQAANNITLSTAWTLPDSSDPSSLLTLQAGNNITLNQNLSLGLNWSVAMTAGADFISPNSVTSGKGGIYLNGTSYLRTQNGSISLTAGKEIIVKTGAIRTINGGSIDATALSGDINTGSNAKGYVFSTSSLGYTPSINLGGISTTAGGDVTLTAGGNIYSFLPTGIPNDNSAAPSDAGSGAFGPQPGVVTVTAGGNVYGHFVAANSQRNGQAVASTITARNGDAGSATGNYLALSLVKGAWDVEAPNGNIYLQEVRNPGGVFNTGGSELNDYRHLFDYDPQASVNLVAGKGVFLEGGNLPRVSTSDNVPIIYPPSLSIVAGSSGVVLGNNLTLFPSPYGELNITTTAGGSFESALSGTAYALVMSDSGKKNWTGAGDFSANDHADSPVQLNNANPAVISVSGDLKDLSIVTPKQTRIRVDGNMDNSTFSGQNLHAGDVTSITVGGQLWNRNDWTFATADLPRPAARFTADVPDYLQVLMDAVQPSGAPVFDPGSLPVYNPATHTLALRGKMSPATEQALLGTLQVKTYAPDGTPLTDLQGNYITRPAQFAADHAAIVALYTQSQDVPAQSSNGYQVGGPGKFNISAASMDLGVTAGVISEGPALNPALAKLADGGQGAAISINLAGDLSMFSSTISSFFGGDISIFSGGGISVGSQNVLSTAPYPRGIFTSGRSDVTIIARNDIDVEGSRIAAYNGGNVFVQSLEGDVNAGSGGAAQVRVTEVQVDPMTKAVKVKGQPISGSGIMATTLPDAPLSERVGNITIETPKGDIVASKGGVVQDALNGNRSLEPTVTLTAGTRDAAGNVVYPGNIDAGGSGVIGVNTVLNAAGNISGLVVSSGNSDISAAANVSGTFFAAGNANFNAGGNISGTVIAGGGISAGSGNFNASAFSASVSVAGAKTESSLPASAAPSPKSGSAAKTAQDESAQQVASKSDADDDEKKRAAKGPVLRRSTGRVTVLLPPS